MITVNTGISVYSFNSKIKCQEPSASESTVSVMCCIQVWGWQSLVAQL